MKTQTIMNWDSLLTTKRLGQEGYHKSGPEDRTEFQRDYDRLIFSAPFRRLQNKTQVFPLPGSIFVHNRLTHSLEVSCVGRSLGSQIAKELTKKYADQPWVDKLYEIGSSVAAACLAHDLGNPPFGHSGENAIATYFSEGDGSSLRNDLNDQQWNDLTHFEGNANALRLLTHQFKGRRKGGFALTYTTLAAIVKYPYASTQAGDKPKFGFFEAEQDTFQKIASEVGLTCIDEADSFNGARYVRHPLVFLVEAADDICYQIMDIEDAHKLKIITTRDTIKLFLAYFNEERKAHIESIIKIIDDKNEQIAYLRSCVIGELIGECSRIFVENEQEILAGNFKHTLISMINPTAAMAYLACSETARTKIYKSADVVDIEIAGYQIITALLDKYLKAIEQPEKAYSKVLLERVPMQYNVKAETRYERILAILDYISGMTDVYALDLYRKIFGMSLPSL